MCMYIYIYILYILYIYIYISFQYLRLIFTSSRRSDDSYNCLDHLVVPIKVLSSKGVFLFFSV